MFKKVVVKSIGIIFCIGFIMRISNINISNLFHLPEVGYVSYNEISQINDTNLYGKFISADLDEKYINVGGEKNKISTLKFKLFGFIPIKQVEVQVSEEKQVFVGGIPLGFSLQTKGLLIVGQNSVLTKDGNIVTDEQKQLVAGDIIIKINDKEVTSVEDLTSFLKDFDDETVTITALRKNKQITATIKPALDLQSNSYKIGYWVRNNASGVGTLTFVDENKNFGALGHPITDYETGVAVPVCDGDIYNCSLIGINKGEKGKPGELKCLFLQGKNNKGKVEKNTTSGVFGDITDTTGIIDENKKAHESITTPQCRIKCSACGANKLNGGHCDARS